MTIKKWPLHPKPYEYQLLYQWVERLSESYGISYRCFCKNVLGLTPEEISSLRTILPENALTILSNGTGISVDDLRMRNLNDMFKKLNDLLIQFEKEQPEEFYALAEKNYLKTLKSI